MPDTAASSPTARHPASRADMALVGERVVVSGLLRRPELNSQVGEATSFDEANGCVSSQAHAHPPAASSEPLAAAVGATRSESAPSRSR